MRLFSLTKEIAIDLGTANTVIIHNDKIVIDEPSIVALDRRTDKLIAVGKEAQLMLGRENEQIRTVRPLRQGVIADFNAAELMIRGLIKKASSKSNWFSPSLRMVVGIPSGSTGVEIRAVRDSSEHAGGRDVYMIYEPMAAALGIGLDVEAPEGNMIVDIGGGTTEIAVISLGGIVSNRSIQIAGDDLTEDIQGHMRRAHNVRVGERTAEQIKMNVGSALTELENPPEDYIVHGPNQMTALPMEIPVSSTTVGQTTTQRHGIPLHILHIIVFPSIRKHDPSPQPPICPYVPRVLVKVNRIRMGKIHIHLPAFLIIWKDILIKIATINLCILASQHSYNLIIGI